MGDFSQQDHDRLAELYGWRLDVDAKLEQLALDQKRIPARVTRRATRAIGRKGAFLIGIGVFIGQVAGGAATPLVQKLLSLITGVH